MEIFNFNMSDNKEDVINALIDVYYDNPELFEDEAYCHFDVDDLTGDIYVFNNTREAEYACACDYILDDDDNIPEDDIRDCVEYFYNEMVDKAEERTSMAKRNGHFTYGESKNRLRRGETIMVQKLRESYDTKRVNELVGLIKRCMDEIESDASYCRRSKHLENAGLLCGDLGVASDFDKNYIEVRLDEIYNNCAEIKSKMSDIMQKFNLIKRILEKNEEANSELFY